MSRYTFTTACLEIFKGDAIIPFGRLSIVFNPRKNVGKENIFYRYGANTFYIICYFVDLLEE